MRIIIVFFGLVLLLSHDLRERDGSDMWPLNTAEKEQNILKFTSTGTFLFLLDTGSHEYDVGSCRVFRSRLDEQKITVGVGGAEGCYRVWTHSLNM